jgi:hypothetical protein
MHTNAYRINSTRPLSYPRVTTPKVVNRFRSRFVLGVYSKSCRILVRTLSSFSKKFLSFKRLTRNINMDLIEIHNVHLKHFLYDQHFKNEAYMKK